jgi:ferredoxin
LVAQDVDMYTCKRDRLCNRYLGDIVDIRDDNEEFMSGNSSPFLSPF